MKEHSQFRRAALGTSRAPPGVQCLEYVVHTAVDFIRQHDFCASAWLLAPFPQLKPLVILLCWPEFHGDVGGRQSLLDTLWKSYVLETGKDWSSLEGLLWSGIVRRPWKA